MTSQQLEQLDKYHSGHMTEKELAQFESELQANPDLQAESQAQSEIIDGLKAYRKAELKNRLEAVNVEPALFNYVQQSMLVKSIGGVMIAASLIVGGIYLFEESEDANFESIAMQEAPIQQIPDTEFVIEFSEDTNKESSQSLAEEQNTSTGNKVEKTREEGIINPSKGSDTPKEVDVADLVSNERQVEEVVKDFIPSVDAPGVASVSEGSSFKAETLDELPKNETTERETKPIDVKSKITRNNTIKYKYYDGKLFLSGDFNKSPYEILEINSSTGRRIYVYYLNHYHEVSITDRLQELPKVTNDKVITELELLRKNK